MGARLSTSTDTDAENYSKEGGVYNSHRHRWEWKTYGKYDRDVDKPSIIYDDGTMIWYEFGEQHRLTGPSFIPKIEGFSEHWAIEGKLYGTEEEFLLARDQYCEFYGVPVPETPGRLTKRATPN